MPKTSAGVRTKDRTFNNHLIKYHLKNSFPPFQQKVSCSKDLLFDELVDVRNKINTLVLQSLHFSIDITLDEQCVRLIGKPKLILIVFTLKMFDLSISLVKIFKFVVCNWRWAQWANDIKKTHLHLFSRSLSLQLLQRHQFPETQIILYLDNTNM